MLEEFLEDKDPLPALVKNRPNLPEPTVKGCQEAALIKRGRKPKEKRGAGAGP